MIRIYVTSVNIKFDVYFGCCEVIRIYSELIGSFGVKYSHLRRQGGDILGPLL